MIGESKQQTLQNLEPISGPLISAYRELAKEKGIWLSLGGLHEQSVESASGKATNAHIVINSDGEVASVYRKVHLFNLEIPGVIRLIESEFSLAGDRIVAPVSTPVGKVGLGICYDVRLVLFWLLNCAMKSLFRFPEFSIALAKAGGKMLHGSASVS